MGGQNSKDDSTKWIHPPDALVRGRVDYGVRFLGEKEVAEAKGAHVVRDAIHAIRFQVQVNRGMTSSAAAKPRKVEIQINVHGVTVVDAKSKIIIHRHPLHKISFCADDKQDKRVFSYIAMNDEGKHICYLFLSDKLAEQITLTIGEAFDLALQQYIEEKTPKILQTEDVAKLKQRISELECENRALRIETQFLRKKCGLPEESDRPLLPDTPVPRLPPLAFRNPANETNIAPLDPPPSNNRRQKPNENSPTSGVDLSGPDVGRKLENLRIDKIDSVFDDSFDPRSGEQKDTFGQQPFSVTSVLGNGKSELLNGQNHGKDLEAMIADCDSKINEMSGFATASLDFGDIGDVEGLSVDEDYVTPSTNKQSSEK
ncbi:hypothetical protein FO519_001427 [Halicephalobus sp. NKZ332]|nr:hypothetical protein FO519_001427 [Halicephalobus sp. NKZ332]